MTTTDSERQGEATKATMAASFYTEGTDDPVGVIDAPVPYCEHGKSESRSQTLGFVYFTGPAGEPGPIKIGFTDKLPRARLRALQCGSPVLLVLHVAIPAIGADEAFLHDTFAEDRLHGEWFRASQRLQKAIRILRTQHDICYRQPDDADEEPLVRLVRRLSAT